MIINYYSYNRIPCDYFTLNHLRAQFHGGRIPTDKYKLLPFFSPWQNPVLFTFQYTRMNSVNMFQSAACSSQCAQIGSNRTKVRKSNPFGSMCCKNDIYHNYINYSQPSDSFSPHAAHTFHCGDFGAKALDGAPPTFEFHKNSHH